MTIELFEKFLAERDTDIHVLKKELTHRAEVINTRDGTIKQLQRRVRKLEETTK